MMVPLAHVQVGDILAKDVVTAQGGTLLRKGKVITARELEILQAFLIKHIELEKEESKSGEPKGDEASANRSHGAEEPKSGLLRAYSESIAVLKKAFADAAGGRALPVFDIRSSLEQLLSYSSEYNILTFMPKRKTDEDSLFHSSVMSAMTAYLLAQWNGFSRKDWMQIALAGLLHDIGNAKIDRSLLQKSSSLTEAEREEIRQHPVLGYQLVKNIASLNEGVKLAVLQHHERMDGSGYPLGVNGSKIHPYARLVAIADVFHAMTLRKTYRDALSPYLVLEQIQQDAFGKLDASYVRTFIDKVTSFHIGTVVRLSDNRIGEIVFSDSQQPTRPWVSVAGTIIRLPTERHLHIQEVISSS
jgi:HD-GYP domain-containing protein (c-di-GMP phosphodiesterase class II)